MDLVEKLQAEDVISMEMSHGAGWASTAWYNYDQERVDGQNVTADGQQQVMAGIDNRMLVQRAAQAQTVRLFKTEDEGTGVEEISVGPQDVPEPENPDEEEGDEENV